MAGTAPKKRPGHKAILAEARRSQRSVQLCLRGDLVAQWQELQRQLAEAQRHDEVHASLDGGASRELSEQIVELREQMLADTIVVTVRALPRRRWTKFLTEHPPRPDDEGDAKVGFNQETFWDALVHESTVEPVFDDDDWAKLDEALSDGQWQVLLNAAWGVNTRDVDVPFSQRASRILASSAPDLKPPTPGESP